MWKCIWRPIFTALLAVPAYWDHLWLYSGRLLDVPSSPDFAGRDLAGLCRANYLYHLFYLAAFNSCCVCPTRSLFANPGFDLDLPLSIDGLSFFLGRLLMVWRSTAAERVRDLFGKADCAMGGNSRSIRARSNLRRCGDYTSPPVPTSAANDPVTIVAVLAAPPTVAMASPSNCPALVSGLLVSNRGTAPRVT